MSVVLSDSFKVRIPYQTTGVEGEEPLFFKILDVVGDVTGPDTTFTIVTLPCPNRPWFGHIAFRDQLRDLWERSKPVAPGQDPSGTTERGAWIVETGKDAYDLVEEGAEPRPYMCGTKWHEPPPAGIVAMVHTHPWETGWYDGICGDAPDVSSKPRSRALSTFGDQGGDIQVANYFRSEYGIRFDYVIYEDGGIMEFEPPQVQFGFYDSCLLE
ncbi:MAG: hypothetical protein ACREMD_14975 [Gemmatimonadota bacterium]